MLRGRLWGQQQNAGIHRRVGEVQGSVPAEQEMCWVWLVKPISCIFHLINEQEILLY